MNVRAVIIVFYGLVVHLIVFKGVLDVYFSSPITGGITPIKSTSNPPAKRVVLIVADGLRAESIFSAGQIHNIPNLNKIMNNSGAWTVSNTRVPTESRPGHVALLAGIYEDPSALLQGWRNNPVDFDSVINQSTNTWGWGAPSVMNIFNKKEVSHVHLNSYNEAMEDFGNQNTITLDAWVVDNVKKFLDNLQDCGTCTEVKEPGNLFFLHLLGMDTAGHGFKPYSREHVRNVKFIDTIIPIVQDMFENAFSDNSTTYIFTADHGMTNWGSHGGSSAHETETPLIIWGAGIQNNRKKVKDINQVDIAPLISGLLGINYPVNSIGIIPTIFLKDSQLTKELLITNVLQIEAIFAEKKRKIRENTVSFVTFKNLLEEQISEQIKSLKLVPYPDVVPIVENCIRFLIEGIDYYQNYYQLPLLLSLTVGLIAWILYLLTLIIEPLATQRKLPNLKHYEAYVFLPVYMLTIFLSAYQDLPPMYYVYFLFPSIVTHMLITRLHYVIEGLNQLSQFGYYNLFKASFMYSAGITLLVHTFVYRKALCYVLLLIGASIFSVAPFYERTTKKQKMYWIFNLLITIVYMQPELFTKFNIYFYISSYLLWLVALLFIFHGSIEYSGKRFRDRVAIDTQIFMLIITPWYPIALEMGYIKTDSFIKHFAFGWAAVPIVAIFGSSLQIYTRTLSVILGFASYYFMVSTNLEPSFLLMFATLMFLWITIETNSYGRSSMYNVRYNSYIRSPPNHPMVDFRRAFFYIVFIFVGFFGAGNIASINTFDPMWVRCFLTVFSPFKMSLLIFLRIIIPFIYANCALRAITILCKSNMFNVFCSVLIFSDLMLLILMYSIKNIGSWLEIGMSLSHFIIMEAFVILSIILYGVASFATSTAFIYQNRYRN